MATLGPMSSPAAPTMSLPSIPRPRSPRSPMAQKRAPSPSPSESPPSHRPVMPRSQPPRPQSTPSIRPPRRPSTPHATSQPVLSSLSSGSTSTSSDPASASASAPASGPLSGAEATSASASAAGPSTGPKRSLPSTATSVSTPPTSIPSLASAPSTVQQPAKKARSNSGSSAGRTIEMSAVAPAAGSSAGAAAGATSVPGTAAAVTNTPQTGASKMAAAAKARAEGYIAKRRGSDVQPDDDHPLSEPSLKARDYHTIVTLNRLFHVPTRWRLIRPLGQGAYGLVIQVQDSYTGEPVAIKCITRVFDKVILARRALREITLLRHFGGHENLTGLIDLDNVWDGFNEIYLYMEPMEADLHQIVRSGQPLSNSHIQFFTYQLLRGMKYIHSANVIHRDLKPGNLLVNSDCELKICDFGLARGYQPNAEDGVKLTEYVATRWYRAPEVMLSNSSYSTAMDVWSMGCILAELLGGKPLFKGKDYVDQINLIVAAIGSPDEETLTRVGSEKACMYMRTLPHHEPVDFQNILPNAESDSLDLLRHLITFDPDRRCTVVEALEHPYVGSYHDVSDEPTCPAIFDKWEQVESLKTIDELREAIAREIAEYRAEVRSAAAFSDEDGEDGGSDRSSLGDVDMGVETLQESWDEERTLRAEDLVAADLAMAGSSPEHRAAVHLSPELIQSQLATGVSPRTITSALPPMRGRDRERSPHTPASVFSEDSTPGPSQPPSAPPSISGGRTSRRSSGHSTHRSRSSFLFSSPLGGGMTPLPSMTAIMPLATDREREREREAGGQRGQAALGHGHGHGQRSGSIDAGVSMWTHGRKSRASSSTSEFASLRPLIRQLSVVGLEALGLEDGREARDGNGPAAGGGGTSEVPPMTVSPSDAPPSEVPKSFASSPA